MNNLLKKLKESALSVLPITAIVVVLHFTVAPLTNSLLVLFLISSAVLIIGMSLFSLGADTAMMTMGETIGSKLTKTRKLWLIMLICFILGVIITVAEPDLTVLANQVESIPTVTLIIAVSAGVGLFLVIALLRIVLNIRLSYLLLILYAALFIIAAFVKQDFIAVAFDSGGVTTGPMTVPFIMALGIGISAVRGGKSTMEDSFGLIALCSVGPILAVMILGIFYEPTSNVANTAIESVTSFRDILKLYGENFPEYLKEMALALSPIVIFFFIFNFAALKLPKKQLIKIGVGVLYTFFGLAIFLTGVNVGFMPAGNVLGGELASKSYNWIIIPIGMIIGFFIVMAEPAVHVLNKQVEEISGGIVTKKSMLIFLCLGVALSLGLSMVRAIYSINIWYIILPGYAIALALSFFVPKIFTGIAFDSGGVASGPMTATFVLPFAMGAVASVGGNVLTDAFGVVALVAMTPLITIQILGLKYRIHSAKLAKSAARRLSSLVESEGDVIIEFTIEREE